jgi:hypothetical protein
VGLQPGTFTTVEGEHQFELTAGFLNPGEEFSVQLLVTSPEEQVEPTGIARALFPVAPNSAGVIETTNETFLPSSWVPTSSTSRHVRSAAWRERPRTGRRLIASQSSASSPETRPSTRGARAALSTCWIREHGGHF